MCQVFRRSQSATGRSLELRESKNLTYEFGGSSCRRFKILQSELRFPHSFGSSASVCARPLRKRPRVRYHDRKRPAPDGRPEEGLLRALEKRVFLMHVSANSGVVE